MEKFLDTLATVILSTVLIGVTLAVLGLVTLMTICKPWAAVGFFGFLLFYWAYKRHANRDCC